MVDSSSPAKPSRTSVRAFYEWWVTLGERNRVNSDERRTARPSSPLHNLRTSGPCAAHHHPDPAVTTNGVLETNAPSPPAYSDYPPESFSTECPSLSMMLFVIGQIEVMRCFTARTWAPRKAGRG